MRPLPRMLPLAQPQAQLRPAASLRRRRMTTRGSQKRARGAMQGEPEAGWRQVAMGDEYLCLSLTLRMGQTFRWQETGMHPHAASPTGSACEWAGTIGDSLFLLRQGRFSAPALSSPVWWRAVPQRDPCVQQAVISDYLRAAHDHRPYYREFCRADPVFERVFRAFSGVRTLRMPPTECLFSYLCSSNNHLKRTSAMVMHLAGRYGDFIAEHAGIRFHSFPTAEMIARDATEADLRDAGFGYRAAFVVDTAQALARVAARQGMTADEMLLSWRALPRLEVEKRLVEFAGIGRKVAGCIALISLDQHGAIPVDTHVWQMGQRYLPELRDKKLTKKSYDAIGNCLREKFGEETAGFAHNVLFAAELDHLKHLMPDGVPSELWAAKSDEEPIVDIGEAKAGNAATQKISKTSGKSRSKPSSRSTKKRLKG